jgi:hypothetical protein
LEESDVTNEDAEQQEPEQQRSRTQRGITERPLVNFADKALLRLYLNVSPLIVCLLIIVPIVLWVGTVFLRQYLWPIQYIFGAAFAAEIKKACPPTCSWHNLLIWAILGGIGLLISFLLSNSLRKQLLKAIR